MLAPEDSLLSWLASLSRPTAFDPPRGVLADVLSSGGAQVIERDALRLSIAAYARRLTRLERTSDQAWMAWEQRLQPQLEGLVPRVERLRRGPYALEADIPFAASSFESDFESLFADPAFESMVAEQWIRADSWSGILDALQEEMTRIVALIGEELDSD